MSPTRHRMSPVGQQKRHADIRHVELSGYPTHPFRVQGAKSNIGGSGEHYPESLGGRFIPESLERERGDVKTIMTNSCCAECGEESLETCKSCMLIMYCNTTCQRKHWPKHKSDCSYAMRPCSKTPSASYQLMEDFFVRLTSRRNYIFHTNS